MYKKYILELNVIRVFLIKYVNISVCSHGLYLYIYVNMKSLTIVQMEKQHKAIVKSIRKLPDGCLIL